jgi:hypothetical protein
MLLPPVRVRTRAELAREEFHFLRRAAIIAAERSVRADDTVAGDGRVKIGFENRANGVRAARGTDTARNFSVRKGLPLGDFSHHGKHFLTEANHFLSSIFSNSRE